MTLPAKVQMSASISVGTRTFSAPLDSPYDRQLLWEFAGHLLKRGEPMRVRIGREEFSVAARGEQNCSACSAGGPSQLALAAPPHVLCSGCATTLLRQLPPMEPKRKESRSGARINPKPIR